MIFDAVAGVMLQYRETSFIRQASWSRTYSSTFGCPLLSPAFVIPGRQAAA